MSILQSDHQSQVRMGCDESLVMAIICKALADTLTARMSKKKEEVQMKRRGDAQK